MHLDEYFSPSGVQQKASEQRLVCLRRMAATRRADTRMHVFGCGNCESCREYASACRNKRDLEHWHPSSVKRSRRNYQMCANSAMCVPV